MTLPVSRCAYKCVEVAEIRKQERPGGGGQLRTIYKLRSVIFLANVNLTDVIDWRVRKRRFATFTSES